MNLKTGVKYIPQTKVLDTYQALWDWEKNDYKSFDNQFEAQGYLNEKFKGIDTQILRIITEVVK